MEINKPQIYIGFITYGKSTAKYLPYFLPSLKEQSFKDFKILAIDNSEIENNENAIYIKNNFPEVKLKWAGKNFGFAKAFNIMIRQAIKDGAEYFLALNPDMIFEPGMVAELIKVIETDEKIAALAPKILKWDFANQQTNIIDSYGLYITKEHHFSSLRQGEIDNPKFTEPRETFGFTGAAVLFRVKALIDVVYQSGESKEYFDELMFMYKEDCDLSYRLRLAGWKIVFAPKAIAYHDRTASPKGESNFKIALNRQNKDKAVKKWSFLNHWILWLKYNNLPFRFRVRAATWWYQIKNLIFIILFEQYLLQELVKLWQLRDEIRKRREQLKIRVNISEIEKFMN